MQCSYVHASCLLYICIIHVSMHTENLCLLLTLNRASCNNSMHNSISIPPHILLDTLILSTDFTCIKAKQQKGHWFDGRNETVTGEKCD